MTVSYKSSGIWNYNKNITIPMTMVVGQKITTV